MGAGRCFVAEQVSGATCAAMHRRTRGDALGISNAARRDHRLVDRPDDLAHQRQRADLCGEVVAEEHAAMTAGLQPCAMMASTPRAASQRASASVVADDRIFRPGADGRQQVIRRQARVKADDRRRTGR